MGWARAGVQGGGGRFGVSRRRCGAGISGTWVEGGRRGRDGRVGGTKDRGGVADRMWERGCRRRNEKKQKKRGREGRRLEAMGGKRKQR